MKSPEMTTLTASEMEAISGGLSRGRGRGLGLLVLLVLALLLRRRTEATALAE